MNVLFADYSPSDLNTEQSIKVDITRHVLDLPLATIKILKDNCPNTKSMLEPLNQLKGINFQLESNLCHFFDTNSINDIDRDTLDKKAKEHANTKGTYEVKIVRTTSQTRSIFSSATTAIEAERIALEIAQHQTNYEWSAPKYTYLTQHLNSASPIVDNSKEIEEFTTPDCQLLFFDLANFGTFFHSRAKMAPTLKAAKSHPIRYLNYSTNQTTLTQGNQNAITQWNCYTTSSPRPPQQT